MQSDNVRWQLGIGATVLATQRTDKPVCDFCSSPKPVYKFLTKDFEAWQTDEFVGHSMGPWAACDPCGALVMAGDRAGLLEQSFTSLLYMHPEIGFLTEYSKSEIKRRLKEVHDKFFKHRLPQGPESL